MSVPSATPPALVGFIGLGMMGAPIAERLQAAGQPLVVYNRTREKGEAVLAGGATWAFTPRDVGRAATAKMVFTALSDAKALERVLFGRSGLARGMGSGSLLVDLSTIAPAQSRAIAERLASQGVHFVDAPMGGSVDAARNGRLTLFVGGTEEDVARARPLLERLARRVEHLGPVGAGTSMKLVNNLLTVSYVALAAEALALADRFGLDRRRVIDLLLDGGAYSRMLEQKRIAFEERRYPVQFKLLLAEKDLKLVTHAAHGAGGDAQIAREASRLLVESIRSGLGEEDFSAVFEAAIARRALAAPSATPAASSGTEPTAPAG